VIVSRQGRAELTMFGERTSNQLSSSQRNDRSRGFAAGPGCPQAPARPHAISWRLVTQPHLSMDFLI
jgi:hypothetical protein